MSVSDDRAAAGHDPHQELPDADRRFIRRVVEHFAPRPVSAEQQARFDRALEARLRASVRLSAWRPVGIAVAGCAGLGIWFTLASSPLAPSAPDEPSGRPQPRAGMTTLHLHDPPNPARRRGSLDPTTAWNEAASATSLLEIYEQSSGGAEEFDGIPSDFLPGEYVALADAFELL